MGKGVPQYRFRLMFQSRALAIQFWNRCSPTDAGTHLVLRLLATRSSVACWTRTNQAGIAR